MLMWLPKCILLVFFSDLAYLEHQETEILAAFTYAEQLAFEPGLNLPEPAISLAISIFI